MTTVSQVGSDVIRQKAVPVDFPLSEQDVQIVRNLIEQMRANDLVGMAAPQIGQSRRIFVTEVRRTKFRDSGLDPLRVFVNPSIENASSETQTAYEGCGSVAESNLFGEVERPKKIAVKWQSEDGSHQTAEFEGFIARIIQHELDHLDGIVFLDRIKTTKTVMSGIEFQKAFGPKSNDKDSEP
ncbi:MAG: peptide deformylase [Pseudomonadota bacterium]